MELKAFQRQVVLRWDMAGYPVAGVEIFVEMSKFRARRFNVGEPGSKVPTNDCQIKTNIADGFKIWLTRHDDS